MPTSGLGDTCPCGSRALYAACCGPVLSGREPAEGAERLMRSRYTAYAVGELDHVFRTWHPRTRPDDLTVTPALQWTGLEILDVVDGGPDDATGEVEFRATYEGPGGQGSLHERSRFERRAGRWVYVDGDVS